MRSALGAQGLSDTACAAIKDTVETWTHALVTQDLDHWMASWAEDGVLMPPEHERVSGRANMLAYLQANFGPLESITFADWTMAGREDLAVVANTVTVTPRSEGGAGAPVVGKQIIVLRAREDGRWLVQTVIFNYDATPAEPVG
jgi:ketosteroid isomerase-like protein